MNLPPHTTELELAGQEVLGYLNFSSGAADPRFLHNLDLLWRAYEPAATDDKPAWRRVAKALGCQLDRLPGTTPAFNQVDQARQVLELVFEQALPSYRLYHSDLLFHQTDETLFRPYFVGRMCEAVLRETAGGAEDGQIVPAAIEALNDFVGHRPVATLRTPQKIDPYPHEWVRPIPWYVAGAGVAGGCYSALIERALEILRATDADILQDAGFDFDALDELAVDPRAYDFEHPANKRPNYHFGQWDPHAIDNRGRYRRFVLVQVTLDSLLERVESTTTLPRDELLFEAASALAGTILMASGVSGPSPGAYDSSITLATLVPRIARYRDAFYERLLSRMTGAHGDRLRAEAESHKQPFGGARQQLNQQLTRRRADQLQRVHLAQVYARMGYPEAAMRQARRVQVASARILCELNCRLTLANLALDRQEAERAAEFLPEIEDLLRRGIECGAIVDPWNILGFQGQFSIFQALENSGHDHRVDDLIDLVRRIFGLYARTLSEAAAAGRQSLQSQLGAGLQTLAQWWDQFASTEVSSVEGVSGRAAYESAMHVASALAAWHEGGAAASDIAFWRAQVSGLDTPKAYALVVEALLEKRDLVAAMALLLHWVSRGDEVPLESGNYSYHALAVRWMRAVQEAGAQDSIDAWAIVRRFFDHLEVNAEAYWDVPSFDSFAATSRGNSSSQAPPSADAQSPTDTAEQAADESWPADDEEDESDGLFSAAYEDMEFRDSAADGNEGDMLESGGTPSTDLEANQLLRQFEPRLSFLTTLARMWKLAAAGPAMRGLQAEESSPAVESLQSWLAQARTNRSRLAELLSAAHAMRIPPPSGSRDSLLDYDRRRMAQQALEERIIAASVEMADAARFLSAPLPDAEIDPQAPQWERATAPILRAIIRGDAEDLAARFYPWLELVRAEPLLYIPLSSKGKPEPIVAAQSLQRVLCDMLAALPRMGMFLESCRLLETAQDMETEHPVGKGAVTEFDRLFRLGFRAQVESLVMVSKEWGGADEGNDRSDARRDAELIECLEPLTEALLRRWLMHSRSLRLSVLEKVADAQHWKSLAAFIETYGGELFTQTLFNVGNLRSILHQGADRWLSALEEERDAHADLRLLDDIDRVIARDEAVNCLELVFEAVLENFAEYRDYNNIATQSDRGELLYMFLDLLRLKARYERVAWNLRPVLLAHEVLVREGRLEAAEMWRQGFSRKTADAAEWHIKRLQELTDRYGLHLPTVADRISERFVRSLSLDRIRALVRPAVDEVRYGRPPVAIAALEHEIQEFVETPSGAGFDVPAWLAALEYEVEQATSPEAQSRKTPALPLPQTPLSADELQRQLRTWTPAGDL